MELWQIFIILSTLFSIAVFALAIWLLLRLKETSIHYQEAKKWYSDLRNLFRIPSEKGRFGELALEEYVSQHLPPGMFRVRSRLENGKTPDLQIILEEGILCVDSKFVFNNYSKYIETGDEQYLKKFRNDLLLQLEKIRQDYIDPRAGTLDFAIAYIPSESIFMFVIRNFWQDVINYADRGVILASPLMLMELIRLLQVRILRYKLPEEIKARLGDLMNLRRAYEDFKREYDIMSRHLTGMVKKKEIVDAKLTELQADIERVLRDLVP